MFWTEFGRLWACFGLSLVEIGMFWTEFGRFGNRLKQLLAQVRTCIKSDELFTTNDQFLMKHDENSRSSG